MNGLDVGYYLGQCIVLVLLLSLPTVGVGALVGLLVGLLQGLTQIQDQTISFALRLVATIAVLIFTARWMGMQMETFTTDIFHLIGRL